jgi:DNA helicase-4
MDGLERRGKREGMHIEFMTTHRSKGREADYVIVVALEDGEYGFPTNISDDPVMRMVLSDPEAFAYAEERRLFYVALTRARRRVYLLAPPERASTFVRDDLLGTALRNHVEVIGEESQRYLCPVCGGKTIRRTHGAYGTFWACANYPLCTGRLDACPVCHDGGLARESTVARMYHCTECDFKAEVCPECGRGYLRQKTGKYGVFLGCSRWRSDGTGCAFTRNATAPAGRR